ncbi:Kelch-like protein 34 [Varanus komodoensis]|uniref:Kelch like family member 34 n=1 Tax=Varanus komodoensis TaxID=61221 RepID=A0A8D2IYB6_VARKO|nr:kelch-like protein 34 [Varanus komodoensis]KAF7250961.1 Kelch-like protein 34 [Varanus komodoensis]
MAYFLSYCKGHCKTVLSQYQTLRAEGLLCDILLKVKENEFPAHKSLLACSSDYFRAMFKSYTKESKAAIIHLHVISATGLQHVLDFIYTSWLPLSFASLEDTLEAATYLQVTEAIGLCSQYLSTNLTLENCCFSANVATKFYLPDALSAAQKFLIVNLWKLLDLDFAGLLELNFQSLKAVAESPDVSMVKESHLLDLLLKWLKHDARRLAHTTNLLEHVRYGLIPVEELRKIYTQSEVPLTAPIKCLIIKAINYHSVIFKQPILQDKYSTLRNQKTRIILLGGMIANEGPSKDVVAFDVYNHKWQILTQAQDRVQNHCVCTIGNFLYVLGGEIEDLQCDPKSPTSTVTNKVRRYDPRFNNWIQTSGMLEKRCQFSCCIFDNKIVAIGGKGDGGSMHSSVEVYNVGRDTWTKVRDLPHKMHGHACTVCKDIIYISGGKYADQSNTSKDLYSLSTLGGGWEKQASMSVARFGHQMATIRDTVYTFLGLYEPFSEIEKYNPDQNQWTRLRPLIYDRFSYGLAIVEETALLIGGKKWQDSQEIPTQDVVGYDIDNDCWEDICKALLPWYGLQCAVLQLSESEDAKDIQQQKKPTAEVTSH